MFGLPPFRVEMVVTALAETTDWGLNLLGVPDVWKDTRGKGVTVAVLDTGIEASHPDLQEALAGVRNFTGQGWPNDVADRQGHGTHCAGIVGARQNKTGVVGVAPDCRLLVGKVLGDDGSGSDPWIAAGVDWAIAAGADVISMSLGSPQDSRAIRRAIDRAEAAGKFVICAAGNSGRDNSVDFPGRLANVVSVAAIDRHGRLAQFSSRGPEVDVAAPGEDVLSCWPKASYAKLSGTSMATPFVAGVVALAVARHRTAQRDGEAVRTPLSTTAQLLEHLRRTARDAGSPGRDPSYGWGLIDPRGLVTASGPPPVDAPGGALENATVEVLVNGHKLVLATGATVRVLPETRALPKN